MTTRAAIVHTTSGPVLGRPTSVGHAFLGVPYAAGPRGPERFQAPRPHPGWRNVRDATEPGPTAPQPDRSRFGPLDMTPYFGPGWVRGEDYLTADVWTPRAGGEPAPVMVFVHGGGLLGGSSQAPLYNAESFARDGVLFIAINYRLGASGFMTVSDGPDNRGLLDVAAALRWVQSNAAGFGGDPDNVTLCGQSAGAILVGALLAEPGARRLFRHAIIQSGSGSGAFSSEQAAIVAEAVTRQLGVGPTAVDLAEVADDALVEAVSRLGGLDLRTATAVDPLGGITPFCVVLDQQPWSTVAERGVAVDLLIGSNTEEAALYLAPTGRLNNVVRDDVLQTAARFNGDPASLIDAYVRDLPAADHATLLTAVLGDAMFGVGTERLARAHADHAGGHTFRYEFAWRSSALGGRLGSGHTMELPFVFDCAHRPELHGADTLLGRSAAPRELAPSMHRAWVNFARTGQADWPEYASESLLVQRMDTTWSLGPYARPQSFARWSAFD